MSLLEALSNMARGQLGAAEAAVPKSGSAPPRPTFLPIPEVAVAAVQPFGGTEPNAASESGEVLDIHPLEEKERADPEVTDRDQSELPVQSTPAHEPPAPTPVQPAEWQLNVSDPSALDRAPAGVLMPVVMTSQRRVFPANDGEADLHGQGEQVEPEWAVRGLGESAFVAPDPASPQTPVLDGAQETSIIKPSAPMLTQMLSQPPVSEPIYRQTPAPAPDVTIGALEIIVSPPAEPAAPSPAPPQRPRAVQPSASSQLRRAGVRRF